MQENFKTATATYEPESNKIRLYVGRVSRDEYEKLRSEGWTSTPKQSCDFVAVWTPERRDTALQYAEIIEDEDQSPEDRAADRAERFSEYREKRTAEAVGHADRYDAGPMAHGYQSQSRGERAARRHDRAAGYACDAWSKAEYWQRRTAGVISHALYKSSPAVRMGRIKEIEADLRKIEKVLSEYAETWKRWSAVAAMTDTATQNALALKCAYVEHGDYTHPRTGRISYLYDHAQLEAGRTDDPLNGAELCALWFSQNSEPKTETDWTKHLKLRIAYELQMLEAQGGRAAMLEMEVGGWIGGHQIRKVNKSPETGRVVSVTLKVKGDRWGRTKEGFHLAPFNIERLEVSAYRPPTEEDKAALLAEKKAEKETAPKKAPCPLVNPTDEDAQRLQDIWNAESLAACPSYMKADFKPSTVRRITQATYSANSGGSFSKAQTTDICAGGNQKRNNHYSYRDNSGPALCKVRTTYGDGNTSNKAHSVIILTDKPQKALPAAVWEKIETKELATK